jgi:hypothetical protein
MLTKTYDYIRVMCAQYWPSSLHRCRATRRRKRKRNKRACVASLAREEVYSSPGHGGYSVTVVEELHYASYIHRRMAVRHGAQHRQVLALTRHTI